MIHKSVLLNEIVGNLNLPAKALVVDGTLGGAGHAKAICEKFPGITLIGVDQDARVVREAREAFKNLACETEFVEGNFRNIREILQAVSKNRKARGIVLDLGISSDQLEASGRGFSFKRDEPLYMTMKENPGPEDLTAGVIVNEWSEESIADIIYGYGEERGAKRIAKALALAREKKKIKTSRELAEIVEKAMGRRGRIHPATKTFQALRIAVNDELGALDSGLRGGFEVLEKGGRILAITFHSLEDRIVKKFFKALEKEKRGKLINKKPILPNKEELKENPRSRSAKLRILEKII